MNEELMIVMQAERQRFERAYWNPDPWHIEFHPKHLSRVSELKDAYVRSALHGLCGLQGIRFFDEWPTIGQKFTYDIGTGKWDR